MNGIDCCGPRSGGPFRIYRLNDICTLHVYKVLKMPAVISDMLTFVTTLYELLFPKLTEDTNP
jgi:hypothetical protein